MKNIFKYLKKSIYLILFIFILLVLQVKCDLSLPQYTSNIVNVGIQQGGIETGAPEVLSSDTYQKILLLSTNKEKKTVENAYKDMKETSTNIKKYPLLKKSNLYKLNSGSSKLNKITNKKLLIIETLESKKYKTKFLTAFGITNPDTDVFALLNKLPQENITQVTSTINKQINKMSDSIIDQAAVNMIKKEYKSIGINTDTIQSNYILTTGGKMLALALLSMLITIIVSFISSKVAASLAKDLRINIYSKVIDFGQEEFNKFSTASLITRNTNDIVQIQMLTVMILRVVLYAPIMAIGAIIKVLNTGANMTWIIAVSVGAILTLVILLFALAMPKFKIIQKLVDKVNMIAREILNGLSVIKAFARSKHEEKRFDTANQNLMKTNIFVNRLMATMMPAMMFLMNFTMIGIVWVSAKHIDAGSMQVGDMMAFMQYTMEIVMSFLMISIMSIMLPRAAVSVKRINEVLNTESSIKDPKQPKNFINKQGNIEFKNVSFRYPDADYDVVTDINFTVPAGKTTAFIGSTGSGKSTIVNLIPRFFDVTDGEILLDGVDIRDVTQKDLHERIGYVSQKGILFSGTIEDNIKYGNNDLTENDINKALNISQATDFVEELKKDDNFTIAQGGANVSGGQKQRLSIARALATKADILIFDDSFSALDFKTDAKLRKELKQAKSKITTLIVAQRISTIMNAEQIIVLNEGSVVGIGTHKELLKNCEIYKQIALSQLSQEEL